MTRDVPIGTLYSVQTVNTAGVGSRIRRRRRELNLTQSELGGDRLSESYVSLIESGRRRPSEEVLVYLAERLGCSVEVLTGQAGEPDAADAEILIRKGEWETSSGRAAQAVEHLRRGIELAEHLRQPVLASRGRVALAQALEASGHLEQAVEVWEALVAEAGSGGRDALPAAVAVGLSRCYRELGQLERAVEVAEQFWASGSEGARPEDRVLVGATMLAAYLELGDLRRGHQLAEELMVLADQTATPMAAAAACWNAALTADAEGRTAEALRLAERAQGHLAQTEDIRNRARLQTTVAGLHLRLRPPDAEAAFRLLEDARPVLRQFASTVDQSYAETEMARVLYVFSDYRASVRVAGAALDLLDSAGETRIEKARTLMVRALSRAALGETDGAADDARRAAELLESFGANRHSASAWTELAELYVGLGDQAQAIDAFRRATSLFGASPTPGAAAQTRQMPTNQKAAG